MTLLYYTWEPTPPKGGTGPMVLYVLKGLLHPLQLIRHTNRQFLDFRNTRVFCILRILFDGTGDGPEKPVVAKKILVVLVYFD